MSLVRRDTRKEKDSKWLEEKASLNRCTRGWGSGVSKSHVSSSLGGEWDGGGLARRRTAPNPVGHLQVPSSAINKVQATAATQQSIDFTRTKGCNAQGSVLLCSGKLDRTRDKETGVSFACWLALVACRRPRESRRDEHELSFVPRLLLWHYMSLAAHRGSATNVCGRLILTRTIMHISWVAGTAERVERASEIGRVTLAADQKANQRAQWSTVLCSVQLGAGGSRTPSGELFDKVLEACTELCTRRNGPGRVEPRQTRRKATPFSERREKKERFD